MKTILLLIAGCLLATVLITQPKRPDLAGQVVKVNDDFIHDYLVVRDNKGQVSTHLDGQLAGVAETTDHHGK